MKCKCDHRDLTGYKEEIDKRYLREEMELYGTKCATCKILFVDVADEEKECLVPSSNQGTYFCPGRIQYNCRYAFCHNCQIQATEEGGRTRRRNLNQLHHIIVLNYLIAKLIYQIIFEYSYEIYHLSLEILYRYNIPVPSNLDPPEHYNVDNIVTNIVTIIYYNINTYIVTSKGQSIIILL